MMPISFCVITDFRRPDKLAATVESIRALNVPDYEIVIAVDVYHAGHLGELRNWACKRAVYGTLVVCDDDILFNSNFYRGLLEYGSDFDVLVCRLINPDGSRHWDWCTYGGPSGHHLLEYDEPDDGFAYPPGGLVVLKTDVWHSVEWDPFIGFQDGAAEDVDYGVRLHKVGYTLKFNPHSTAMHADPRYTQTGNIVIRRDL